MVSQVGRKIVYIAPMKALAQEVVEKFSSKLKALKIVVKELTGDMQLTRAEADRADILVTTVSQAPASFISIFSHHRSVLKCCTI